MVPAEHTLSRDSLAGGGLLKPDDDDGNDENDNDKNDETDDDDDDDDDDDGAPLYFCIPPLHLQLPRQALEAGKPASLLSPDRDHDVQRFSTQSNPLISFEHLSLIYRSI